MERRTWTRLVMLLAALALIAAACGGGDDDTTATSDDGSSDDGAAGSDDGSSDDGASDDGVAGSDDGSSDDGAAASDDGSSDDGASDDGAAGSDDGSSDDGASGDDDGSAPADGDASVLSLELVPDGETDILGNPAGQAFVEVDGARYDFVLSGACQKIFEAIQGAGPAADGSDGNVDMFIPPENWESFDDDRFDPPYVSIEIGDDEWVAQSGVEEFVGTEYRVLTPEESAITSFSSDGSYAEGEAIFFKRYQNDAVITSPGSFALYCP